MSRGLSGVDCTVYSDGQQFADGTSEGSAGAPLALSGLKVAWGRSTTIDQPEPATCTFSALFPASRPPGLWLPDIGSQIDVEAAGLVPAGGPGDDTVQTLQDPGFELGMTVWLPGTGIFGGSWNPNAGVRSLRFLWDPTAPVEVYVTPGPVQPAGAGDTAWDQIPVPAAGQSWHLDCFMWAPPGMALTWGYVGYSTPQGTIAASTPFGALQGSGAWSRGDVAYTPPAGLWVGLQFTAPPGPFQRVCDIDPATRVCDIDPAQMTADWGLQYGYVDDLSVTAPDEGGARTATVFTGRCSDVKVSYFGMLSRRDGTVAEMALLEVTAQDFLAELAARNIGDEPWPAESLQARAQRILALAGLPLALQIDPGVVGGMIQWQDVDNRPAADLLKDVAQSVDGVLWATAHRLTGQFLRIEDPTGRFAGAQLVESGGQVIIVNRSAAAQSGTDWEIASCRLPRDPVDFTRTVDDMITRATVRWLEYAVDEEGQPGTTEHSETIIDTEQEAAMGTRGISIGTQLTTAGDAQSMATGILARLSGVIWGIGVITLDDTIKGALDDPDGIRLAIGLLDSVTRAGARLLLTGLPAWTPVAPDAPLYLEGGTYTYEEGAWKLELATSSTAGLGQSARIADLLPGWRTCDFAPTIRTMDLRGAVVAAPDAGQEAA